ncbi:MAG TPA: O-antigen ligase family protein [Casimicrobiaceae bacterium]
MRSPSQSVYSPEFVLLACIAFALPMFEGAKNILWGLYALAWYVNRLRYGWSWEMLGGRWDRWDTVLTVWLASAVVGAALAGMHHDEWRAFRDTLRMTSILWFLKRSGYGDAQWLRLHVTLQAAVTIATIWALAALAWPHRYEGIQLNSVGHVNQSVIYIVICFGTLLGGVSAYWRRMRPWLRAVAIAEFAILLVALFAAGSRSAAVTAMLGALAFGLLWLKRSARPIIWILIAIGAFGAVVAGFDTDMRRKQEFAKESAYALLNERHPIWQQALAGWRTYPAFGVGADNFRQISVGEVRAWQEARGERYDPTQFVATSHAHSLYLNTLAERGLLGIAVLALLLGAWAWSVFGDVPRGSDPPLYWLNWTGAASALVATACIGVFNTTLHDEHGLLATMLLGVWLGHKRSRAALFTT